MGSWWMSYAQVATAPRAADSEPSDATPLASSPGAASQPTPGRVPRARTRKPAALPLSTPTPLAAQGEETEQRLQEYEIRLAAHRRALLERENELEAAKRRISELGKPAPAATPSTVAADDDGPKAPSPAPSPVAPTPSPSPAVVGEIDETLVSSLQHELDVERENRATLEQEIQRLVSESRSPAEVQTLTQSVDGARAQILFLNQRLAEEQRARESLEVTLERMRNAAGIAPGADWMERFEATMRERRTQSERLQEELHNANEAIVQLKAKLETQAQQERPIEAGPAIDRRDLEDEVTKLREALRNAEQANADLRTQAELAGRLADMLYGQGQSR